MSYYNKYNNSNNYYYKNRGYNTSYKPRYKKGKYGKNIFWKRLNNKSYYMAKKALSMINVEYKYIDTSATGEAITNSGNKGTIIGVQTGDTSTTRDGDSLKITRIGLRSKFIINSSATESTIRLMLVLDKQCNGTQASLSQTLETNTSPGNIVSFLEKDNRHRFRVLLDKIFHLDVNNRVIDFKYNKNCQMKVLYTLGNAGTVADMPSKNLYWICISDEAVNTPTMDYAWRVRFVDN